MGQPLSSKTHLLHSGQASDSHRELVGIQEGKLLKGSADVGFLLKEESRGKREGPEESHVAPAQVYSLCSDVISQLGSVFINFPDTHGLQL